MAVRRSSLVPKVLLIVAIIALLNVARLAFVGPASARGVGQRQELALRAAESKAEQAVEEADESVQEDWFSTDPTSGGITWLWILVPGAILFYVYLDLVYGERCISSYLNVTLGVVRQCPLGSGAAVEVRQCPLGSGARGWGPAMPTGKCPVGAGARGWGLAVPTRIWSSRLRLNVSSYPSFFLINGGQHEPFPGPSAEEIAAFVSARVRGKDPDREIRKVLLKMRPMLYRDDTPPEEVLDLEPELFDDTVLKKYPENNRIWIIEFYSDKCPFCRTLKSEYRRAAREVDKSVMRFAAVNLRAFPDLAERFGVPWNKSWKPRSAKNH
eukprot:s1718_g16.t2